MNTPETAPVRFNLRVYGLWINSKEELMLSEEWLRGQRIIYKFPGGGMELGEGAIECLHREWREETGLPVHAQRHFYTTDFYQRSAFNPEDQIVSLYYLLKSDENQPLEKLDQADDLITYHWVPLAELSPERVSLPIDQHVVRLLLEQWRGGRLGW